MDISKLKIFDMMQSNLSYLSERQDVLSQNVANADVPGYKGKDLKPMDFSKTLEDVQSGAAGGGHLQMTATQPGHISGTGNANTLFSTTTNKTGEATPTGNTVVIEDEMLKLQKNNLEYQQTSGLYSKMLSLMKTAIGSGS